MKINLPLLLSIYRRGFAINKRLTIGSSQKYPARRPALAPSSAASTDLTPSTKVITATFRFFTPRLRLVPAKYPLLNDFEANKGNCHRFVSRIGGGRKGSRRFGGERGREDEFESISRTNRFVERSFDNLHEI